MKAICLAPLFFLFLSTSAHAVVLDRIIAVVGTEAILKSEVQDRHALIKGSPVYANILGLDPKTLEEDKVLDLMIEERILNTVIGELGATVSDADVFKQIDSIAKQNNISRQQLEASLKSEGIPFDAYANNIRTQLQKRTVFERELRAAASVGEDEIRSFYNRRAQKEYQLILLELSASQNKSVLNEFKKGSINWVDLSQKHPSTDLGWLDVESLNPDLAKLLKGASTNQLLGPHSVGGRNTLVYIAAERMGSEEEFQKVKANIAAELQGRQFEERFEQWFESKKKEMHIVVNK